ncbi:MAG: IPT/TIG domain-containing protein [Bryobacteraceae bacterium]|nr:IPT/TIG domain-containing protein [Bryobacteraceae bacterium]
MRLAIGLFLALLAGGIEPLAAQAIRGNQGFLANSLPPGDDGPSSQAIALGFTINFFGKQYSSAFVNHNGNITFEGGFDEYTPEGIGNLGAAIIAPFWADVDTLGQGRIVYGRDTVNGRPAFGVIWDKVGYYDRRTDKANTFQVVLIDRSDTGAGNFDIEMNYEQIQWEVGEASHDPGAGAAGVCVVGPPSCIPASAGYSNGTRQGGTFFSISGSLVPGAFLDNGNSPLIRRTLNSTVPGRLVFEARGGQVQQSFITSLSPSSRPLNSGDFELTINGSGFISGAQVLFGGATLTPLSVTGTQIVVRVGNSFLQTPGPIPVRVRQADANSNAVDFTVTSTGATLSSLSPSSVTAGSPDFDLTLTGSGFVQGASVLFGSTVLTPASLSATQIVVRVTTNLVTAPGSIQVRVRQNNVDTAPLNLTVTSAPVPSISAISPASRVAGSEGFDLTISGANFQQGATVLFGQTSLTPRSVSATQIVVAVAANLIQSPGTIPVRVRQTQVDSNTVNFTVTAVPVPRIISLSPESREVNSGGFTLTITGENFIAGAVVRFGGDAVLTPSSLTTTQIVASVENGMIQNTGDYFVTVVQNQQESNPVRFTVTPRQIAIPPISLSGGGTTIDPGTSGNLTLSLQSPAPVPLSGTVTLSFTNTATGLSSNYRDPATQFVSGGVTANFTIPAGQTTAVLANSGAFNAGTVAGAITFTLTSLESAGVSLLPDPAPSSTAIIGRIAPVITPNSVRIVNSGTGFNVELQGYSTPRDLAQARFTFTASPTARLEGESAFTVEVSGNAHSWFILPGSGAHGSRFLMTVPFTVTGDANLIQSVSVALINSAGTSAAVSGGR